MAKCVRGDVAVELGKSNGVPERLADRRHAVAVPLDEMRLGDAAVTPTGQVGQKLPRMVSRAAVTAPRSIAMLPQCSSWSSVGRSNEGNFSWRAARSGAEVRGLFDREDPFALPRRSFSWRIGPLSFYKAGNDPHLGQSNHPQICAAGRQWKFLKHQAAAIGRLGQLVVKATTGSV